MMCVVLCCAVSALHVHHVTSGVVLCDPENPCEHLLFDNVTNTPFRGNVDKLLEDLPYSFHQHDVYRAKKRRSLEVESSSGGDSMPFGDYLSSYAYGKKDNVSPDICFEEGCWWEPEEGERR